MKHLKVFLIASILTFSFLMIDKVMAATSDYYDMQYWIDIEEFTLPNGISPDTHYIVVAEKHDGSGYGMYAISKESFNNKYYVATIGGTSNAHLSYKYPKIARDNNPNITYAGGTIEYRSGSTSGSVIRTNLYYESVPYSKNLNSIKSSNSHISFDRIVYSNIDLYFYNASTSYKYLDISKINYTQPIHNINFHLNGGWVYNKSIDFGSEEDFSLSLYTDEFIDFMNNTEIKKQSMIFENWYYDEKLTQPFSTNDNISGDFDLYAKFRYKVVDDFLSDSNFIEYEYDQNYLYALLNRGDKSKSVYIGLPFEVFDLEIYEYNENSLKVKDGASACPVPIIKKDGYYYYDLNTLYTKDQEVLILPKKYFDNSIPENYHFYLTDNAYIHYTNDLAESTITDSNGNEVTVNFKNSYEISRQYHDIYSNKENLFAHLKIFLAQMKKITSIFTELAEYFFNSLNETTQSFLIYIFIVILIVTIVTIIRRS